MKNKIIVFLFAVLASAMSAAQTIEPATFKLLQQAQSAQDKGNLQQANQILQQAQVTAGSYEQALVWRSQAYVVWQLGHNKHALGLLSKAHQSGKLEQEQIDEDRLSMARLLLQNNQPAQALKYLPSLPANKEELELAIYAWQAQKRLDKAVPLAERFLQGEQQISDQWLEFMVAANAELKRYQAAQQWQQQLVKRYPQQVQQWRQLAVLQQLAGKKTAAFATLRTSYQQGMQFSVADFDLLISLAINAEQPLQAALLLQELLDNKSLPTTNARRERLAQLLWQARERQQALVNYQTLATATANPDHWLLVAQIAIQESQWQTAEQALQQAAKTGASRKKVRSWQDWLATSKAAQE